MLVSLGKADFGETATQYGHLLHGTRLALLRNTATFSSLCGKPERSWVSCFGFSYRLQPCSEPGAQLNLSPGLSSGEDVSRCPAGSLMVAQVPGSSAFLGLRGLQRGSRILDGETQAEQVRLHAHVLEQLHLACLGMSWGNHVHSLSSKTGENQSWKAGDCSEPGFVSSETYTHTRLWERHKFSITLHISPRCNQKAK